MFLSTAVVFVIPFSFNVMTLPFQTSTVASALDVLFVKLLRLANGSFGHALITPMA